MKRGSRVLLFLVIVIIILIAVAFFVIRGGISFGGAGATPTSSSPMVNIVIVGQPINRDDEIKEEALTTMPYSQASVTAKMITDQQLVIGKFALYPLAQGMPLTIDMIAERPGLNQPGSEAAKVVSPGLVAISIPISRLSSVAFGIRDGDRINVIATTMFVDVDSNFQSKLPNFTAKVTGPGFFARHAAGFVCWYCIWRPGVRTGARRARSNPQSGLVYRAFRGAAPSPGFADDLAGYSGFAYG